MANSCVNDTSQAGNNELVGWMPEGNDRGTWSIIATSVVTIIICTWTVLHPRIHVGRRLRRCHKVCQLVKQVLAPELESIEALQEFIQARKTIDCCTDATKTGLKLAQSFYVGMMGIRYKVGTTGGHRVLWPMQYAYLLNKGLISWPPDESYGLSVDLIKDKSKADGLVKLAALWQVTWFTINCITRSAHNMELAPIESMTLAYVVQTILTYCLWWNKPKDITTVSYVSLPEMRSEEQRVFESLSMEATYDVPDPSATHQSMGIAWYIIPRDCGETAFKLAKGDPQNLNDDTPQTMTEVAILQEQKPSQVESYEILLQTEQFPPRRFWLNRATDLAKIEIGKRPGVKSGGSEPTDTKVVTEWDDVLYMTKWWPIVCLLGCSFGAVHLISWNAIFPTHVELWLWRASSIGSIVTALVTMQFKKISFRWQGLITIIQIGAPVLYVVCRILMVAEVIAAFRALPRSTYETYEVTNYWFHLV